MTIFDETIANALDPRASPEIGIDVVGEVRLPGIFDVSGLALAATLAAGRELARLTGAARIHVDRGLVEDWFGITIRPIGWTLPDAWDPVAGNYRARDGWIRLHTNVPAHLSATLSVLGVAAERAAVARAVEGWERHDLEDAVVRAGGVAAAMRSLDDWAAHPQGRAVAAEPLVAWSTRDGDPRDLPALRGDLDGLRVLDLTRVLAGPVATRFLAGFGARVLRVDPPDWREDGLAPETTLGKACCGLDLRREEDRARFEALAAQAHVLVHGYRPDALARLGYDEAARRALNPGLIDVALCAYGWTGPWSGRRGFDTVVQMNAGLAHEAMVRTGADGPVPLPVQALDHATGYLMAASVLRALRALREEGCVSSARLSLARTAALLVSGGIADPGPRPPRTRDPETFAEETAWGPARRVAFPLRIDGRAPIWRRPAAPFRSAPAEWP